MEKKQFYNIVLLMLVIALFLTCIEGFVSLRKMSARASYWMNRAFSAEEVIAKSSEVSTREFTNTKEWKNWWNVYVKPVNQKSESIFDYCEFD